jgi:hypothetical protein
MPKGKRRRPQIGVVGAREQEPHAGRDRAIAADDRPLGPVGVQDRIALERQRVVRVVVIAVVPDLDLGVVQGRFEEHHARLSGDGVERHWVGGCVHR